MGVLQDIIKTWQTKLREHVKAFADEARMGAWWAACCMGATPGLDAHTLRVLITATVSDWDADVRECNQKLRTLAEDVNKLKVGHCTRHMW